MILRHSVLGCLLLLSLIWGCKEDLSSEKQITAFKISAPALDYETEGTIDQINLSVSAVVPTELDIKRLSPKISISEGATINPPAEVNTDFTGGVVYTVTAADGSVANYFATVTQKSINATLNFIRIPELNIEGTIEGQTKPLCWAYQVMLQPPSNPIVMSISKRLPHWKSLQN